MANIFPIIRVEQAAIQTARHTSQLHKIPDVKACKNDKLTFVVAVDSVITPTASLQLWLAPVKNTRLAIIIAPTKFPI